MVRTKEYIESHRFWLKKLPGSVPERLVFVNQLEKNMMIFIDYRSLDIINEPRVSTLIKARNHSKIWSKGTMNDTDFDNYVSNILAPKLRPGQVVLLGSVRQI